MKTREQDHLDWYEVLCGCGPPNVDPQTRREAEILRSVLLGEGMEVKSATLDLSPGLERVLERPRHEGLLDRSQREPRWRNWLARLTQRWHRDEIVWLPRLSVPIAVAATFVFGVLVLMRTAVTPEEETELFVARGGFTPQVIFTDDPAKLVSQI